MSNELATLSDKELNNVLRNSLYPNASDMSLELVKGYCKAANLDIMLKPVHIVPLWNSAVGKMVDVIMPGIGLYRTTAARTKQYAGISEPEFGPSVTRKIGNNEYTFPEWCKVTVKRKFEDTIAEFTAQEYWLENYAIKGGKEKSIEPNAMWSKRPFGQLKKCAEAQALRMAFPEVGEQPTSDEMEGKEIPGEKVINPLPEEEGLSFEAAMRRIETSETDDFSWIEPKLYTEEQKLALRKARTKRKQELLDAKVVYTQEKEPQNSKNSGQPDWEQMILDAESMGKLEGILAAMPGPEMVKHKATIEARMQDLKAENDLFYPDGE